MLTRSQLIRTAGVMSGAALIGGLDVSVAEAMHPRVDSVLHLTPNGGVDVTGPFNGWDADEIASRIMVGVVQGSNMAIGNSKLYMDTAAKWACIANPCTVPLKPGPAIAYAVALVLTIDSASEWYTWEVPVTLTR